MKKALLVVMAIWLLHCTYAVAQSRTVTGKVSSTEDGSALPGVSVALKGTTTGTITNIDGNFNLTVPAEGGTLVFSFIGMLQQEVPIGNQSSFDVAMAPDSKQLSEVVVTALGREVEKKSLGYAVQEVSGEDLNEARTPNLLNAMSGKVAGVQVTSTNGAPGSSSRVTIRGSSSIGSNNQPLFVVDGVPIDNGNYNSTTSIDYGNGAAAINPDDIASMSVLKGPAAAALYGSRGANGVILITTKNGKGTKGIGVSVNSNTSFETPFRLPDFQDSYGQGTKGDFKYVDGKGGGVGDGVDESWGPALDGRLIEQFDSPLDENGNRIPTPWVAHPDNWKNFYETGKTFTNNIAITGGSEKADFRLSLTNLESTGILPNTNYDRNTISLNAGYQVTPKLSVRAIGNYVKDGSDNRQNWGLYSIWFGRQVDISKLENYLLPGSIDQYNWNYNYWSNPYYALYESTRANDKDRLYGNLTLNYKFTPWLDLMVRTGTDFSEDRRKTKGARFNATRFGNYGEEQIFVEENNSDFLLNFNKDVSSDFNLTASVGGNHRTNYYQRNYMYASELAIPNVYNLGNSRQRPTAENSSTQKEVNSLYGSTQLAFRNYLFLDVTARNDWSSTLPSNNNSYFYPSASVSAVLSDMLNFQPSWLSFAKVRAGVAKVGNDTDPYRLMQTFNFEPAWGSTPSVSENNTLLSPDLKPEITTSFETGFDIRFFNDRLGIDFTYYDQTSKNQILNVNISNASGFSAKLLNAGKLTNKGIELQLNATPVKLANGFQWDLGLNYARNRNKVVELADGLVTYQLGTIRGMGIEARVGEAYGAFFGSQFLRAPDGQIVYSNGLPERAADRTILGNVTPDWTGGIANTFSYKGFTLYSLVDVKWGGDIFSQTVNIGRYTGVMEETTRGREEGIVGEGVMNVGTAENPQYVPNDVRVSSEQWHHAYYALTNNEVAIFDGTYVKLREARLSYTLPNGLFGKLPFRDVNLAIVGRNLLLLHSNVPHIDPESSYNGSESNVQGVESGQILSTRSLGFNINFKL
ncbi:SusC/RagA family TonB-linked outer membrane protein [Pontibacter silvestris]|uniref:SusC/RagA family TonB-linked outer membrane protein n=1 Tax=Pontibacter silvestris TaxID=2305183 RepID=A0ABW4X182_9BACT|nr:SusC/RagA family TonB-linked outer membrane protein [Pontibacter silvestris]MCC9135961.1 SusC/RagA family TonB-linked outer membrane protein [Pontibacter silvestris]